MISTPTLQNPLPMKFLSSLLSVLLLTAAVRAETSLYAGQQSRAIKALSADEIAGYRAGRGLGLARAAELNGYPGPRHVLDAAAELALTPAQTEALTRLFEQMRAAAIPLGEDLIARETELDRLFTSRRATMQEVQTLTAEVGRLQGELRAVHLNAHLATVAILSPAQISAYNTLRGYDAPATGPGEHSGHNHGAP